ncbi:MAG: type III secretion system gatekeeper subunit SctW [Kiritimatiellae bacterium]|nr:type III secretion system gatekeeper subunit SctW [Kiritimatiellia bacterium]
MAFDAAQILRQTYAAGADAARMSDFAQPRTEAAPPARGELMGMSVVAEADPMAELMDSMEELSFQFEEKEMKRAGERKMGEMQGPRTALLKAIETWMKMMPDMPNQEFMARLARNLRGMAASGQTPDPHELLKELGRGSTDPSHQFAMLDILEQAFGAGEEELRALVRETKARLAEAKGPEIRAGINLAEEVNARATTPEQMQELRDMYRSEVVGFTKPQDCFRSLLAARGPGGLADAIQFLIAGCGKDLASASPSLESAALGRILTDLNCVQVLQTVLDSFTQLAARMGKQFGETCLLNGEQLTGRVVDFTEQAFIAANAIAAFVGDCGLVKLMAQMDFTRELTRLFRLLSPRLFAKEGDRQRLVDAAQEHLDLLVERENEEEEGEGAA